MARDRLDLHTLLKTFTANVYFQTPGSMAMQYPAIVYSRDDIATDFADNVPYRISNRYEVIYIDRDPDSEIPKQISSLPMCKFNRHYVVDGLNHDAFTLYF